MKLAHSIQVATAATAGHGDTGRGGGRREEGEGGTGRERVSWLLARLAMLGSERELAFGKRVYCEIRLVTRLAWFALFSIEDVRVREEEPREEEPRRGA